MSTLGEQIKELREKADMLDGITDVNISTPWVHAKLTPMLREAAGTIISLRDRLQAAGETCEDVSAKNGIFECSECGCTVEEDGVDCGGIHHCPDCGKWVER